MSNYEKLFKINYIDIDRYDYNKVSLNVLRYI